MSEKLKILETQLTISNCVKSELRYQHWKVHSTFDPEFSFWSSNTSKTFPSDFFYSFPSIIDLFSRCRSTKQGKRFSTVFTRYFSFWIFLLGNVPKWSESSINKQKSDGLTRSRKISFHFFCLIGSRSVVHVFAHAESFCRKKKSKQKTKNKTSWMIFISTFPNFLMI